MRLVVYLLFLFAVPAFGACLDELSDSRASRFAKQRLRIDTLGNAVYIGTTLISRPSVNTALLELDYYLRTDQQRYTQAVLIAKDGGVLSMEPHGPRAPSSLHESRETLRKAALRAFREKIEPTLPPTGSTNVGEVLFLGDRLAGVVIASRVEDPTDPVRHHLIVLENLGMVAAYSGAVVGSEMDLLAELDGRVPVAREVIAFPTRVRLESTHLLVLGRYQTRAARLFDAEVGRGKLTRFEPR